MTLRAQRRAPDQAWTRLRENPDYVSDCRAAGDDARQGGTLPIARAADETDCDRMRDEHGFCRWVVSKTRATLVPR